MWERFLRQERDPVFTVISLVVTAAVWVLLLVVGFHRYDGWGGGFVAFAATAILLVGGSLVNGIVGFLASRRGEYPGGAVAGCGIVLWFVTVGITWGLARYH